MTERFKPQNTQEGQDAREMIAEGEEASGKKLDRVLSQMEKKEADGYEGNTKVMNGAKDYFREFGKGMAKGAGWTSLSLLTIAGGVALGFLYGASKLIDFGINDAMKRGNAPDWAKKFANYKFKSGKGEK